MARFWPVGSLVFLFRDDGLSEDLAKVGVIPLENDWRFPGGSVLLIFATAGGLRAKLFRCSDWKFEC
jgi:hypothetical protein